MTAQSAQKQQKYNIYFNIYITWDIKITLMTAKIVLEFLLNKLRGPSCQVHGKLEIPLRNHTAHAQIFFHLQRCHTEFDCVTFHPNIIINYFLNKEELSL